MSSVFLLTRRHQEYKNIQRKHSQNTPLATRTRQRFNINVQADFAQEFQTFIHILLFMKT